MPEGWDMDSLAEGHSEKAAPERVGQPGGNSCAWHFTWPLSDEGAVVYHNTTPGAIRLFQQEHPDIQHFEIRWMSDNE